MTVKQRMKQVKWEAAWAKYEANPQKSYHPLWGTWVGIRKRCYDPLHHGFEHYGAKGVTMYPPWQENFWSFANCVGKPPNCLYTLDRIDLDGDYDPLNVRWATANQQANNTSANVIIDFGGRRIPPKRFAHFCGVSVNKIYDRIKIAGGDVEQMLVGLACDADKQKF